MPQSKFLLVACEAAKAAEAVILKYFRDGFDVEIKSDQSPVTAADKGAEAAIIDVIKKYFPEHGFLGEETGDNRNDSGYTWVIDPIDGTKNFVRRLPYFATLLALMRGDEIILGVSNDPIRGELFYAEKGSGAYVMLGQDKASRISVSDVSDMAKAYADYGALDQFHKAKMTGQALELAKHTTHNRGVGGPTAYHYLAKGNIDIVVEPNGKLWDFAAPTIIIAEAGGKATDLQGNPITKTAASFCATNGLLHGEVLKYFTRGELVESK